MEVAFYHDDPSNRISGAYDPQSSPGSVESINSTDAGPVAAIASVLPVYRQYDQGDFNKTAVLKGMSLSLNGEGVDYGRQPQLYSASGSVPNASVITTNPSSIPGSGFQHTGVITNSYAALDEVTNSNLSLSIPENNGGLTTNTISTPDVLNMLKNNTPEFERPSNECSNNNFYPRNTVTQEQEMYAQGFVRELERLKSQSGSNSHLPSIITNSPSSASHCSVITSGMSSHHHQLAQQQLHQPAYGSPDPYYRDQAHDSNPGTSGMESNPTIHHMGGLAHHSHVRIPPHGSVIAHLKEEPPQTVPVISKTPPISPINLEEQEKIKTERKRLRNRVAASKCRKRKLERISRLEDKVNNLKSQNLELSTNANLLRQQVADLKSKVMTHVNSGCQLMMSQQQVTF